MMIVFMGVVLMSLMMVEVKPLPCRCLKSQCVSGVQWIIGERSHRRTGAICAEETAEWTHVDWFQPGDSSRPVSERLQQPFTAAHG
ncbi:hypothetical protein IWX85_004047 [Polaromonas sp. CG_9.11]|nr:hypothetical protein [Polaromonas sp. CG_9.11]